MSQIDKKIVRKYPPPWFYNLKRGEYTVKQVMSEVNLTKFRIYQVLEEFCLHRYYKKSDKNHNELTYVIDNDKLEYVPTRYHE